MGCSYLYPPVGSLLRDLALGRADRPGIPHQPISGHYNLGIDQLDARNWP